MHLEILNKKTRDALKLLGSSHLLKNFYLGGGTGLSLYLGHRLSYDLNFFSRKEFSTRTIIPRLQTAGPFSLDAQEWGTLHGQFAKVKISLLYYKYPLFFRTVQWSDISIADHRDIGCMKIDAISSRGTKKDFIDLFFLLKIISLKEILSFFDKKYRLVNYSLAHILKSLVYFEDARREEEPKMLLPYSWKEVEHTLEHEVKALI